MDTMEAKDCENRHFAACQAIGEIAKTADRQIQNFASKKECTMPFNGNLKFFC